VHHHGFIFLEILDHAFALRRDTSHDANTFEIEAFVKLFEGSQRERNLDYLRRLRYLERTGSRGSESLVDTQ
jgi:hypothetical protein